MATKTISLENSVTLQSIGGLPIVSKFGDLMQAAVGSDSIYDVAKTNLTTFAASLDMTDVEKANVLADFYKSMIPSMTNACLSAAVQVVIEDRDGQYKLSSIYQDMLKTEEEKDLLAAQNEKVNSDIDNIDQDKDIKVIQGWKLQADMVRDNGVSLPTNIDTKILSTDSTAGNFTSSGIKLAQEKQIKGSTYSNYAKSFRDSGVVDYELASSGDPRYQEGKLKQVYVTTTPEGASPEGTAWAGLTNAQTEVAIRQKDGFDENILQHVANSSASFMGMLLSGGQPELAKDAVTTASDNSPLRIWSDALIKMNSIANPTTTEE